MFFAWGSLDFGLDEVGMREGIDLRFSIFSLSNLGREREVDFC